MCLVLLFWKYKEQSMAKTLTVQQFFEMFPDDDSCVEHLFKSRYGEEPACPKCGQVGKFGKLANLPAYTCNCGHHIHPMVGTPFEDSRTPLQKWFYAMYLFTTSRHGVPAKELQRQLGVTYKCAWRIGHQIRKYMAQVDGDDQLSGIVEADEAYIGGKEKNKHWNKRIKGASGAGSAKSKSVVFGMIQRGGDIKLDHVEMIDSRQVKKLIDRSVHKEAHIMTDEAFHYNPSSLSWRNHGRVNHHRGEYVRGLAHTNSIEGFWSQIKRSISGTHVHVSKQHLQKYLGEFEFRYNMRKTPELMFSLLLGAFAPPCPSLR
jgi:transposase-like protein